MEFKRLSNLSELRRCLTISIAQYKKDQIPEFPIDESYSLQSLMGLSRRGLFRVQYDGKDLVGWLSAVEGGCPLYSRRKTLTLAGYHTSLRGRKAVKALVEAQYLVLDYAEALKYEVVTANSVLSTRAVFNRILGEYDWFDRGGTMVAVTTHYRRSA
jgi:hypothetical protein